MMKKAFAVLFCLLLSCQVVLASGWNYEWDEIVSLDGFSDGSGADFTAFEEAMPEGDNPAFVTLDEVETTTNAEGEKEEEQTPAPEEEREEPTTKAEEAKEEEQTPKPEEEKEEEPTTKAEEAQEEEQPPKPEEEKEDSTKEDEEPTTVLTESSSEITSETLAEITTIEQESVEDLTCCGFFEEPIYSTTETTTEDTTDPYEDDEPEEETGFGTLERVDKPTAKVVKDGVLISWNAVDSAYEYGLYRKVNGTKGTKRIALTKELSYLDENVEPGTVYRYYVLAEEYKRPCGMRMVPVHGKSKPRIIAVLERPKKPKLKRVKGITGAVDIFYEKDEHADGIQVKLSRKEPIGLGEMRIRIPDMSKNRIDDLYPNTYYYFSIRNYVTSNGKEYYSSWSARAKKKVK